MPVIVAPELEAPELVVVAEIEPEFVDVSVVPPPNTAPPVPVVDAAAARVPVQVAPVGQQAMFFALSVVHIEPAVQQAPPYFALRVEQEPKLAGQEPSLFSRSWGSSDNTKVPFERMRDPVCGS